MLSVFAMLFVFCLSHNATEPARHSIAGRVIDALGRQALEGSTVVLVQRPKSQANAEEVFAKLESGPQEGVWSARSDGDGRFSVDVPEPGFYAIFVRREGYVDWGERGTGRTIEIRAGEKPADLLVELLEPVSIAGRVEDGETREALRGFRILPMRWLVVDGALMPMTGGRGAVSDGSGRFALRGLAVGSYVLRVIPPAASNIVESRREEPFRGRGPVAYLDGYYSDVLRQEEATPVLVTGGGIDDFVVRLKRRPSAGMRACLTGQAGEARVMVSRVESTSAYNLLLGVANGKVAAGGCFHVDGLPPGRYYLQATQGREAAYSEVELDDARVDNLQLVLQGGIRVEGRLRIPTQAAGAWPADRKLQVRLEPIGRAARKEDITAVPVEGADLRFVKEGVMGPFRIYVDRLPAGYAVGQFLYNGASSRQPVVRPSTAVTRHELELVLEPATGSVEVGVAGGEKAAGFQIVLLPESHEEEEPARQARAVTADARGRALFAGLLAGRYRIFVFAAGTAWRTDPAFGRTLAGLAVEVRTGVQTTVEAKPTSGSGI